MRRKIGAVLAASVLALLPAPALFPAPAVAAPVPPGAGITVSHPADGQTVSTGPLTVTGSVRTGPAGVRSVTVERDGRPPFPATVTSGGDFTAEVGTIGAGVHRIVVRAVFGDGRTAERQQWFTGRAGSRYVALGDSWSAGAGVGPYRDRGCPRSATGWPARVRAPGGGSVTVEACAGWTGTPQRLRALGTDADLVTVTFGGDDIGLAELAGLCATRTACGTADFPGRRMSLDDWARIRTALLRDTLDDLYRRIRARVRPDTTIVAVTYPHLPACAARPGITPGERRWLTDRTDDLDEVIIDRAAKHGLLVADVRDAFRRGGACDHRGPGSFHPNENGMIRYAEAVSAAIRQGKPAKAGSWSPRRYPDATVTAVRTTRLVPVEMAAGRPACDRPGGVRFLAGGFTARSTVIARWSGARMAADDQKRVTAGDLKRVTADDQGWVSGWATLPAGLRGDAVAGLEVRGPNPQHGTTLGAGTLRVAGTATCADRERSAAAPRSGLSRPASAAPRPGLGHSASAVPHPGLSRPASALPRTGMPGWTLPATAAGIALILLGLALVRMTHSD
ncbi:GDSL-type esterase/lipase family protein [Actinoplanes sp. NPDC023936]|uniref:GDSL-type esterase/lipase family protein n=1 Tax=Actinoplanes sp. NPDC023936 TaxID=3154910 RepID=UPI0033F71177